MPKEIPEATAYARVTSLRRGRFVEFLFVINDDDLSLELIMPVAAFSEFCKAQDAIVVDEQGVLEGVAALPAARTTSGLYRRPDQHAQPH